MAHTVIMGCRMSRQSEYEWLGDWKAVKKLLSALVAIDERIVVEIQSEGCPRCGGKLYRADYARKPRGLPPEVVSLLERRFSLCCAREGCRRRVTPPSVCFMGRRLYPAPWVVLAAAYQQAAQMIGIGRRTAIRWKNWWRTSFRRSSQWGYLRTFLMPPIDESRLPASLFERFAGQGRLVSLLQFISRVVVQI